MCNGVSGLKTKVRPSEPRIRRDSLLILIAILAFANISVLPIGISEAGASPNHNSWSAFLNSQVGNSCTLSSRERVIIGQDKSAVVTTSFTQRLRAIHKVPTGKIFDYSLTTKTVSTSSGGPAYGPLTINYPLELFNRGELGVSRAGKTTYGGTTFAFDGEVRYPSIAYLHSDGSATTTLILTVRGVTAEGKRAVRQAVGNGSALRIAVTFQVSSAPARTRITTPNGTYSNLVGVRIKNTGDKVLNAKLKKGSALKALAKSFNSGSSDVYYAKGIGEVRVTERGLVSNLTSCSS